MSWMASAARRGGGMAHTSGARLTEPRGNTVRESVDNFSAHATLAQRRTAAHSAHGMWFVAEVLWSWFVWVCGGVVLDLC